MGAAHATVLARDPRAARARPRRARARARSGPLAGAGVERERARPSAARPGAAIAAGEVDPASCSTPRWPGSRSATRRSTPSSRPSRSARARCSRRRPDGPLHGVPVVIKDEWPLPWRAQRFGAAEMLAPTAPGESGPYRALRDAGAVIVGVGNMHELGASSTGNVSVYGAGPQPLGHRALPGRLLERPGRRGRRPARRRRGRRRRARLDPLPRRLLRPDRAEADLRPLGDGRATTWRRSRPLIVSGPLCADAADCRLLGSALYGEELAGRRRRGPADRRRPRRRLRRRRPRGPRGLRGGDRGAARGDRRRGPRGRAGRPRRRGPGRGPDRQRREPRRGHAASGSTTSTPS